MCSVVKKDLPALGPGVLCSVDERGMLLHEVHEKHITCNSVARRGWLRAEEVASREGCRNGLFKCENPDLELNLIEAAPIVHSG